MMLTDEPISVAVWLRRDPSTMIVSIVDSFVASVWARAGARTERLTAPKSAVLHSMGLPLWRRTTRESAHQKNDNQAQRENPSRVARPFSLPFQRRGATPSRPLRTFPGLRTNDAMAGFLTCRSVRLAVFPEFTLQ